MHWNYARPTGTLLLLIICLSIGLSPGVGGQTQSAALELISNSPQVDAAAGTATSGVDYEIQFSTLAGETNRELQPAPLDIPFDLYSTLVLQSSTNTQPLLVEFAINLPFFSDANQNDIFDFFDQAAAVNNVSVRGHYRSPLSGQLETVNATWSRPQGSLSGLFELTIPDLGLTSVHNFRIRAFLGEFDYARSGQQLTGTVEVVSVHDPAEILTGNFTLNIQDALTLTSDGGTLQSSLGPTYQYNPDDNFDHVGARYWSNFILTDGYPSSTGQDYNEWMAFLDGSDSDGDGIPNLVDDPSPPVIPPSLAAVRVPSGMRVTITGTAGSTYALEAANEVNGTWSNLQTVLLVAKTHSIILPTGAPSRFLRLRVL